MAQNSQSYQHYISDVPTDPGFPRDYQFILVESLDQLRELLEKPVSVLGFDIETTGLNSETDDIVSYSFCYNSHIGYNVPVDHDPVVNGGNPGLGEEALDMIYEFMVTKANFVAIHNYAFESRMMEWHGFTSLDDHHKRMWLGLDPFEENEFFTKENVCHYFKYDMSKVNYFDTMVSCWLSDTNDQKTGLKKYEEKFLGWRSSSFEDTLGDNVNFKFTNYRDPAIIEYTCLDAIGAFNLALRTKRFFDEAKLSGKIDMDFIYVLMRCSTLLQRLDPEVLKTYEDELSEHLYNLEQECWNIVGQPFNLKSPKDKARVFELLGLNTGEVGKSGVMKTGKDLLNKLKKSLDKSDPNYKLLDNITQFGILSTVKNTFVKNLLNACESGGFRENYTRFNYKATHVPTGRLSAAGDKKSLGFYSDLNIQNIPKPHPADYHAISIKDAERLNPELMALGRNEDDTGYKDVWYYETPKRKNKIVRILGWLFTQVTWKNIVVNEDGKTEKWPDDFPFNNEFENPMIEEGADQHLNIRSAMLPFDDDDYILSLDYSGQELKAAAMLSREPVWFDAFASGGDAHKQTAYAIFGEENYDKEKRKLAKGLNFGIIYGMEAYSIYSRGLAKTPEEAEDFYTKFKAGLPVLFNWLDSVVELGKRNGTVYTMFGRPRRVKYWLDNSNYKFKSFGERTCKNTVVQGCLPYGTKILTDKGYIPIGKIFDSKEEVNVWTGMKYAKAVAVDKGEASLADIELENGMVLHCDNRHKVKVNDGENYVWKHIQDLKVGDLVCTNHINCNPVNGDDLDYLMGYIIGDGHVTDNSKHHDVSIYFGNDSDSLLRLDKIKNIIISLGFIPHIRQVSHKTKNIVSVRNMLEVYSVDFINLLRSRGLEPNQVSNTKTVPSSIWLSGAKEFLQGLYDSDGCKTYSVVRWHMNNESLLKDVAILVNMLGYNSNLSRSGKYYILNTETGFKEFLLDSSRSDIRSKGKYMIPHSVALNAIELLDYNSLSSSAKVIYNRIKRGGSCNQYWLEFLLGHNLYESYNFSKVSNIVFKDVVEHTYTMSVQDDLHQFISDGFVSKNTGADITKTAMTRVFNDVLSKPNNRPIVRFMSTVHDEVNYSVKKKYFPSVAQRINKLMTIWISTNDKFPFDTGLGIGLRWGELFDFNYDKKTFEIISPKWDPLPPKPVEYVTNTSIEEVSEEITYDFSEMFEGLEEDLSNEF